jgi:hypothetical protein
MESRMSTLLETSRDIAAAYTRPATREAMVAEAIGCIITGRVFPDYLRAPSRELDRPASVEAGIGRILAGPAVA